MLEEIKRKYSEIFGEEPEITVRAPGRVNLIGEHVDYQGGYVFPIAIDKYIYFAGKKRSDGIIKIYSYNYRQIYETEIGNITYTEEFPWANYLLGVFKFSGERISGANIVFGGNIPVGSGLSSSAAVEIATASFIQKLTGKIFEPLRVIEIAKRAENEFVGVPCGIMDQFSSYLCKKNYGLLLNCKTLDYQYIPLNLGNYKILLVDTKKERKLVSSEYNKRVESVNNVLEVIKKKKKDVELLVDVSKDMLEKIKGEIDELSFKRALHIIEENGRVLKSVEFLKNGDIESFGNLLYKSHESLKNLYEVSCEELDLIVDFSKNYKGAIGARLTGAGFGGCAIVIIDKDRIDNFENELKKEYRNYFGKQPEFYRVNSVNGAYYELD